MTDVKQQPGVDRWLLRLRGLGWGSRTGVCTAVLAVSYSLVTPVAWKLSGRVGLAAAALAAGCCWLGAAGGGLVGGLVGRCVREPGRAGFEFLSGMIVRMGVPLACALAVQSRNAVLANVGLLYYLVFFYLVTLAIETTLSLPAAK
jgi:hypothetical protein